MSEMRSWIVGRKRGHAEVAALPERAPLTAMRVSRSGSGITRSFGRRDVDFAFDRVFIPSLVIDHTELSLRQAGGCSEEGFVIWAGSLSGGHCYVSSLVAAKIGSTAIRELHSSPRPTPSGRWSRCPAFSRS